jgi:ribosomal protein S26
MQLPVTTLPLFEESPSITEIEEDRNLHLQTVSHTYSLNARVCLEFCVNCSFQLRILPSRE